MVFRLCMAAFAASVGFLHLATAQATDLLRNGAWADGANCVDHAWNTDYAYIYTCHGEPNQQWNLTTEGYLRSAQGYCMEMFDDNDRVAVVPCDTTRPQKWYATGGLIKPQGFRLSNGTWVMRVGFCLDATQPNGKLILHGCHGALNQKFSASFLTTTREDVVENAGPWRKGANCLDYDYSNGVPYIYECHGQWNQRWYSTKNDELRVGTDKCLEYEASKSMVFVRTCTSAANQQWLVRDDKLVQAKSAANLCLNAPYPTTLLSLAACDVTKATQQFTSAGFKSKTRDLLKVDGPQKESLNCVDYAWGTELAYVYSCHGEANQLWEFTADEQIRTADNKCLEFDGDSLTNVSARTCNAQLATQKWKVKASRELVPRGYFTNSNVWRVPTKCLDVAAADSKLQMRDCSGGVNQKFQSEVFPVRNRDYLFADGGAAAGRNCLRTTRGLVVLAKCSATREMLWEFLPSNGTLRVQLGTAEGSNDQCLTANLSANKLTVTTCANLATQRWERRANGEIALQATAQSWDKCLSWVDPFEITLGKCSGVGATSSTIQKFSSVVFDGVTAATGDLGPLFESANELSAAVKADGFLTATVLARASTVVDRAAKVLSSSTPSNAQRAAEFLTQFLTKSANVTNPSIMARALFVTSESEEFLLMLSMLLQSDSAQATTVLTAIEPALQAFSDQLLQARYEVLLDHVLQNDTNRLEAYTDGTLSDFDQVGGILSAVCEISVTARAKNLAMCRLAAYFSLIDQFFVLKYKLLTEGARGITEGTRAQAAKVAKIFSDNVQKDPLWTQLMNVLVLGTSYVNVLPASALARASDSSNFLPAFVLYAAFGTNPNYLAIVDPMVRFLSDQITTFHVNNILTMVTNQDIAALEAYMAEPFGGFRAAATNLSDFPTMAQYVAPLVCSDESRIEALSLCRLQEFHSGLQSVLRFERSRRSDEVSLADLLEVDVRKKLDVLDAEKKQYEVLSTLQDVANQIGSSLIKGMADLKQQIDASTTAIRGDIEKTRQDLRAAIGSVGQTLQDAIQTSTQTLTKEVGEKAAALRGDLYESTRQLTERLDDTGRAILGSIEQSKQELKYQIGAEAEQTRQLITAKSEELKTHMTKETHGLREFIDVKTNQVIGVVREESALTREKVDNVAGQIIRTVEKEGAMTRAFVDTKTNEIKEVVRAESQKTRDFVDVKTNAIIKTVQDEAKTTRAYIDEKGNEIIGVVKEEGEKTRKEVRAEGEKTRQRIDEKTEELKGVIHDEGDKTRDAVNAAAIDLKNHVTNQTNQVKERINQAQSTLLASNAQQFQNLSRQIGGVSSSIKNLTNAVATSTGLIAGLSMAECQVYETANTKLTRARDEYVSLIKLFEALVDEFPTLTNPFDAYDLESLLEWLLDIFKGKASKPLPSTETDVLEGDYDFWDGGSFYDFDIESQAADAIFRLCRDLYKLRIQDQDAWDEVVSVTHDPDGEIVDFKLPYEKYFLDFRAADTMVLLDFFVRAETTACSCNSIVAYVAELQAVLRQLYSALDLVRSSLTTAVTAGVKCENAKKTKAWAKSIKTNTRLRALQTSTTPTTSSVNEPYYAMVYSTLTKLLLDYRIQEAAFQFCKYYEFKNGGVAPPMCGSASDTKIHYTMAQIQEMRSWQPAAQRRLTTRLMLPTQPASQPVTGRLYPFVDLRTLQAGGSVLFTPPTWDLNWLKKYAWVLTNTKEETFPSYYVESIRLYLPIQTNDTTGGAASSRFAVTVTMESMPEQFPSYALRNRKYKLPVQSFEFDTTFGHPFCVETNKATNPYHAAAECIVSANRTSELCVLSSGSTGTDTTRMLLPSLFATWRISADFDRSDPYYQLVQPLVTYSNTSNATPELNLFADVTLVQANSKAASSTLRSGESVLAEAGASPCCSAGEYKTPQAQCAKCPAGSKTALNGYTCSV